jgi:hypothetical protein
MHEVRVDSTPFSKSEWLSDIGRNMKLRSNVFYSYALFVATAILVTLLPVPAKAMLVKYHLNAADARLLYLSLLLPTFIMWFALFYGYGKLQGYGQLIKGNRDGKQVAKLADGLLALALGLPLSTVIGSILTLIARQYPSFTIAATVIPNYFDIVYVLVAFAYINMGARGLNALSRNRPGFAIGHTVIAVVIVLGVIFCDLIARANHSITATYHLSSTLVMLTFAIPYMYIWFLGLYAIAEMYAYSKQLAGVVYRKGWNRLAAGLGSVIILDIVLQYLNTLSTWLNDLNLAGLLLLLYVLLFLLAGGFIVVALGTKDLMKIEEV